MPKIKVKRSSTIVDMTAMTDVSFLLLTFFILTAKFRPSQPVVIDMPSSESETVVPDNLMVISVDKEGKVYYSMDNPKVKIVTLQNLIERYGATYPALNDLTDQQIANFANVEMMGYEIAQLPQVLSMPPDQLAALRDYPGVPIDSANNELRDWIQSGRWADRLDREESGADRPEVRIAIKGDKDANIQAIQEIIKTLTNEPVNIHTFNLITTLEGPVTGATVAPVTK
ncbi:MAG: biopolymer transporter ExbD [Chitinophagales bacterium]|jgi:biopolymer transport protein ExbD|nr:biopolymer transporter ExbD [Bacteroidota bacterium]MBK7568168.1 biopolymer transporter ExbD [Bacteroidota bacterium]MBP8917792.1 biopolymer transporter ExbD [Chitinophagales bacterium]MBP9221217.1 biopolymer transporter ExbD [Chitinophagales bacterium]